MDDTQSLPGFYRGPKVAEACRPFFLKRGHSRAILMVHGYTGSPADFRDFAGYYADGGYDVAVPLLPGHGSHIALLERQTFRELYIPIEPLYDYMSARYEEVHVLALSYGSILATRLAFARTLPTLTLLAPAFFLSISREKKIRWTRFLGLHKWFARLAKPRESDIDQSKKVVDYTYRHVALRPLVDLYEESARLRPRLKDLNIPVFHAHGDMDTTTPLHTNRTFLSQTLRDYHFHHVKGGIHVLPVDADALPLAGANMAWLEGQAR